MDARKCGKLAYRIKQLENNVKRAESQTKETQLHLQALIGTLQSTKLDFENLREIIKQ